MMPQAEALYQLQQVDLQILQSQKHLDEIGLALKDSSAITNAQAQVDSAQKKLAPLRTKMRDLELEIQSNNQKARSTEDRLYGGSVKNPKELQEMQQEIAALNRRNAELEDQLLEQMMAVEDAENELGLSEAQLRQVTEAWEGEHGHLLVQQADLESRLEKLKKQREASLKNVTPENLKTYNSMKTKKANQPIAALRGRSCAVCGIEQTTAIEHEVRRGHSLVPCLNCGRILADVRS